MLYHNGLISVIMRALEELVPAGEAYDKQSSYFRSFFIYGYFINLWSFRAVVILHTDDHNLLSCEMDELMEDAALGMRLRLFDGGN
jgi:hypothetical protein